MTHDPKPMRPELLAVAPCKKLPASTPADAGLTPEDMRTWDRLPKVFVKTSPEKLRAMARG